LSVDAERLRSIAASQNTLRETWNGRRRAHEARSSAFALPASADLPSSPLDRGMMKIVWPIRLT
jgi:hypothetical protein